MTRPTLDFQRWNPDSGMRDGGNDPPAGCRTPNNDRPSGRDLRSQLVANRVTLDSEIVTGSSDICRPVRDLEKCLAFQYILPNETILFALQSSKEEYSFTNEALVRVEGESASTKRKLVERFDYKSHTITNVQFETAGRADRDCEIKFSIGATHISIDVATAEEVEARLYYKVLELLGREQISNARMWEHMTTALGHAASALRLRDGVLTKQSDDVAAWLEAKYHALQPRCYRAFLVATLQDLRKA